MYEKNSDRLSRYPCHGRLQRLQQGPGGHAGRLLGAHTQEVTQSDAQGNAEQKSLAAQGYRFCNRLFLLERALEKMTDEKR